MNLIWQPFIYDYQEEDEDKSKEDNKTPEDGGLETPAKSSEPLLSKIPLTQKYILCPRDFKDGYLMELLRSIRDKEIKLPVQVRSMIIFAATIRWDGLIFVKWFEL